MSKPLMLFLPLLAAASVGAGASEPAPLAPERLGRVNVVAESVQYRGKN